MHIETFTFELTKVETLRLDPIMVSWQTVYNHMKNMGDDNESLDELKMMLQHEVHREEGPRPHILNRVYGRLTAMRSRIEFTQMGQFVLEANAAQPG